MHPLLPINLDHIAKQFCPLQNNKILVHWWGHQEDFPLLTGFANSLKTSQNEVTTILYDQAQMIKAFNETAGKLNEELPEGHIAKETFEVQKEHINIIDVCCFSPTSLLGEIIDEGKPAFIQYMRSLFQTIANPDKQYVQLRLPSEEAAEESGMPYQAYESLWHDLVSIDYFELKSACSEKISQYKGKNTFEIHTGKDCILTFSTEGRSWHSDHGNGDFPAGEVYIAPLEDSVNGSFCTPLIFWEGAMLTDVILSFEKGLLVGTSHPEILESLQGAPGDALKFAEFGIGLNPKAKKLSGYNLFDEKSLGSCHIAIGMNHLFGGTNDSPVHIDFVAPDPLIG